MLDFLWFKISFNNQCFSDIVIIMVFWDESMYRNGRESTSKLYIATIGADTKCRCKSNYHAIITRTMT